MSTPRPAPVPVRRAIIGRQAKQIYIYIETFVRAYGYAPSLDEIAAGCFMSRSTATRYIDKLEAWGLLARDIGVARSLRLLPDDEGLLSRL